MKKKKALSDDAKFKIVLTVIFAVLFGILVLLYIGSAKSEKEDAIRQKHCWNEIYAIIETSPQSRADWIKLTIQNRANYRGDVNYCSALELIKNGQDK